MNKTITLKIDEETSKMLEEIKKELKISKSGIVRLAIKKYYKDQVNN